MSILDRFLSRTAPDAPADAEAAADASDGIGLVVGLGNPGPEYDGTRHNAGFELVDRLAREAGAKWNREHKLRAKTAVLPGGVVLAKPLTYMNLSGNSVARLLKRHRLDPARLLVVYDDTALPVGALRFRASGSAGGHNGIKSIIATLGGEAFPRLRIGVGPVPPDAELVEFVLGRFSDEERAEMEKVLEIAAEGVNYALASGLEAAMNRYNRRG